MELDIPFFLPSKGVQILSPDKQAFVGGAPAYIIGEEININKSKSTCGTKKNWLFFSIVVWGGLIDHAYWRSLP